MAQVDTAIKNIRIVSERGLVPSPTEVSEVRKCGPLDREQRSQRRPGRGLRLNNEMTGGVAVVLNPPAMVPEDVDVSVTPLVGDVGSILLDVVSLMVAEGVPLADHVDKVLIDSVGVSPLAMAGGGGSLICCGWHGVPGRY